MKTKTQILTVITNSSKLGQAIFCPFTGTKIIHEDPYNESINETNYPSTVMCVWAGDSISFEESLYWNESLDFADDFFEDIDSVADCAKAIDKLGQNNDYIIINAQHYGDHPGDFGQFVFLIKRPN